jgi:acetylornithine aminotransferase
VDLNDLDAVKRELSAGDVAAVIVEGIQGIGGIYVPEPAFLEGLAGLCRQHGSLLILDEIQSGYGRSGQFFAFQYANIEPDIISMAKGMGNGFPIGGILIHPRIEAKAGMLGTTFGGNHLACAAGIAVLDIIYEEKLVKNAARVGDYLMGELAAWGQALEIRGHGLMIGLQMREPVGPLRKQLLFEHGVFTGSASDPNTLRLLPSLAVGEPECEQLLAALRTTSN